MAHVGGIVHAGETAAHPMGRAGGIAHAGERAAHPMARAGGIAHAGEIAAHPMARAGEIARAGETAARLMVHEGGIARAGERAARLMGRPGGIAHEEVVRGHAVRPDHERAIVRGLEEEIDRGLVGEIGRGLGGEIGRGLGGEIGRGHETKIGGVRGRASVKGRERLEELVGGCGRGPRHENGGTAAAVSGGTCHLSVKAASANNPCRRCHARAQSAERDGVPVGSVVPELEPVGSAGADWGGRSAWAVQEASQE